MNFAHLFRKFNLAKHLTIQFVNVIILFLFSAYILNTSINKEKIIFILLVLGCTMVIFSLTQIILGKSTLGDSKVQRWILAGLSSFGVSLIVVVSAISFLNLEGLKPAETNPDFLHPVVVFDVISNYYVDILLGGIIVVILVTIAGLFVDTRRKLAESFLFVALMGINIILPYYVLTVPDSIVNNEIVRLAAGLIFGGSLL